MSNAVVNKYTEDWGAEVSVGKEQFSVTLEMASLKQFVPNICREVTQQTGLLFVVYKKASIVRSSRVKKRASLSSFLTRAQRLLERRSIDEALDLVYDVADEMLLAGEFNRLNTVLCRTEVDRLHSDILLGVLTITAAASSQLPDRPSFFAKVETVLRKRGDFEDGLLAGLE